MDILSIFCGIALRWMAQYFADDYSALVEVTSYSDNKPLPNGLVPSGKRPLPEPMMDEISVAVWIN